MFRVFFSWQSDLNKNQTLYFIREAIDEAIKLAKETELIEAERDEATQGKTGSPDIVQSILSKINECDLFIADLSLCYTVNSDSGKKSPNPNVLFELGYASNVLGWERIICICNTDFGKPEELPFDIAHHRILSYSLSNKKTRRENSLEMAHTLLANILELGNVPKRPQVGMANHIIGMYNWETHSVDPSFKGFSMIACPHYESKNAELKKSAHRLVADILDLTEALQEEKATQSEECCALGGLQSLEEIKDIYALSLGKLVSVKEQDIDTIRRWLQDLLGTEVQDTFFSFGNLKKRVMYPLPVDDSYEGTEVEIAKYEKYTELISTLSQLWKRIEFVHTFDEMIFIPLAIQNTSSVDDCDISISVIISDGKIVSPDKDLITETLDGLQGQICEDGIISELFAPAEDGFIHRECEVFPSSLCAPQIPRVTPWGLAEPEKDDEDYVNELSEYIVTKDSANVYEFQVQRLRPGECRWLSQGLLIKKDDERKPTITYRILSSKTTGSMEGTIEQK